MNECGNGCDTSGSTLQESMYQLFGVVSHRGDMQGGHYVAYIKCEGFWYQCDDAYVTLVTEADVTKCEAYMLYYAQKAYLKGPQEGGMAPGNPGQGVISPGVDVAESAQMQRGNLYQHQKLPNVPAGEAAGFVGGVAHVRGKHPAAVE